MPSSVPPGATGRWWLRMDDGTTVAPHHRLAEGKEIKVKIPLDYHIKLHTLKVLKGQSISDTVEAALARYFEATSEHEKRQVAEATRTAVSALDSGTTP